MSKVHLTTTINGEARELLCEPYQTLLEVLRDALHDVDAPDEQFERLGIA